MEIIPYLIGIGYLVGFIIFIVLCIYLVRKRLKDRKKEDFEKRDF
jgi:prolipoprotein diacylglyceryltransferase